MRIFTVSTLGGLLVGLALAVVASVTLGFGYAIPVLIALALWIAFALGFRTFGVGHESADGDAVPTVPGDDVRPLGDTPDAHDEISPHDLPVDHPGRHAAEHQAAATADGTTRGNA